MARAKRKEAEYVEVERTITYECPVRGLVTETVKGKQYCYKGTPLSRKYTVDLLSELDGEDVSPEEA